MKNEKEIFKSSDGFRIIVGENEEAGRERMLAARMELPLGAEIELGHFPAKQLLLMKKQFDTTLAQTVKQYNAVVLQNQSLQREMNGANDIRNKIVEFLAEMSSQNNRGTRFPYYYTIIDYNDNYVPDDRGEFFYDPYAAGIEKIEDCIRERYEDDLIELNEDDNLEDILKYIGTGLEDSRINEWLEEHINETLQRFSTEPVSWFDGVFFTEKDAEAYLKNASNHHSEQAHTYVDCMCKWGRSSQTEEFLTNLFNYFGVKVPPEMYYDNKKAKEGAEQC